MDAEREQQIQAILADLPHAVRDREAFLDRACGSDPDLRSEVEARLTPWQQPTVAQETQVIEPDQRAAFDRSDSLRLGESLGPYRLLRPLGRGGMGTVFLAERADEQFRKQVAVKVVRRGMDTEDVLLRFRHERQILANLDHPNIACLLDGGMTEDGRPYLVMEYAEGVPIDTYCSTRNQSTRERLELFRTVCGAVHYAHRNLVVHRDLKPSNILVTEQGTVKLLDFGIAKLLSPDPLETVIPLTQTGMQIMTPAYASPEQIRGEPITTSTDVFSLGVLLYVLLTGKLPHKLDTLTAVEVARVICEEVPVRPSTVVGGDDDREAHTRQSGKLRQHLSGDLDNVVLMALRKEPARRYASAEQFSEDLRRHMVGLPVMARADTFSYRFGKFVQRNRVGVAAALAVTASITGLVAFYTVELSRERDRAQRRFDEVRVLANSLLFELHDSIRDLPGSTPARQTLVQKALTYLDGLARETDDDPSLQLDLAQAYERVGEIQGQPNVANLGDLEGAQRSYEKALAIRERLAEQDPANGDARRALAASHARLAEALAWSGDTAGGITHSADALAILESVVATAPDDPGLRFELARMRSGAGMRLFWAGRQEEAAAQLQLAVDALEPLADAGDVELRLELATAYLKLGDVVAWQSDSREAIRFFQRAIPLFEAIRASEPGNTRARRGLWASHLKMGENLSELGQLGQALQSRQKSLESAQLLAGEDPTNYLAQRDVALSLAAVGDAYLALDRPEKALAPFRESLMIVAEQLRENPQNADLRRDESNAHGRIGHALFGIGDLAGALEHYERAERVRRELVEADPANTAARTDLGFNHGSIARVHRAYGQNETVPARERVEHLRRAREWYRRGIDELEELKRNGQLWDYWSAELEVLIGEHEAIPEH